MNFFDFFLLAAVLVVGFFGFMKGLVRQLLAFFGLVLSGKALFPQQLTAILLGVRNFRILYSVFSLLK